MRSSAPRYAPNDGVIEAAAAALGDRLLGTLDAVGEITLTVARNDLVPAMVALRDTPGLDYQQLVEIAGVDYPERAERFDVCYHLLSLTRNHRIRVRVTTDEAQPIPSITGIWPVAGWLEREVYDLYGVLFSGNADLRRILTDYGFRGHPQRKDFPLSGYVELRYSEEAKRVVYEPVQLAQDFRSFDFMSPWEGAEYILPGDEKAPAPVPAAAPAPPAAAPTSPAVTPTPIVAPPAAAPKVEAKPAKAPAAKAPAAKAPAAKAPRKPRAAPTKAIADAALPTAAPKPPRKPRAKKMSPDNG
ncbi:MAG: NADH-quinone oxidoreductase subunit C [Sphingomonas sp.]